MKRFSLFILILFLLNSFVFSQGYGKGALLDENKFKTSPKAPTLTRGDFVSLPSSFSFKNHAPIPGNQGTTSTCSGWAISYAARTILESISNNWDASKIGNAFSPSYVYNQIRNGDGCNNATSLIDGLNLIKNEGVLPYKDFGYNCDRKVEIKDKMKASKYRIKEYREILNFRSKNKVLSIKKSISQSKPVVIGIKCPISFYSVNKVWNPLKDEYHKDAIGHALTIIGYDDNKYGGAFEIINSWGVNWGDSGFAWIRYDDMNHFCVWAAELIGFENKNKNSINVDIQLQKINGKKIKLRQNNNSYLTVDTFRTGDMFQLFVKNKQPTYLYIFSFDTLKGVEFIFPNDSLTSEYLAYNENNIVLPSEEYAFELDEDAGVSSFIIILSTIKIKKAIVNLFKNVTDKVMLKKYNDELTSSEMGIVFYNSKLNKQETISINKSSVKNFLTLTQIDILHLPREK